jgi:hypothetical protein
MSSITNKVIGTLIGKNFNTEGTEGGNTKSTEDVLILIASLFSLCFLLLCPLR